MTSSLRNSIHRRNHKERSQLAHRTRLGVLEKHKDYVKRARDYHSKQDRIVRLRQKAAERNKDEFYFAMNKERTQRGVHVKERGNVALPTDIVKVLKTQDENYVRTARAAGRKKIDKIKSQLMTLANLVRPSQHEGSDNEEHMIEEELDTLREAGIISACAKGKAPSKHVIFVDNDEEAHLYARKASSSASASRTPTDDVAASKPLDLGWKAPPSKKKPRSSLHSQEEFGPKEEEETSRLTNSTHKRLLKELGARIKKDKMLGYTQREFEMQRLLMGKGARRKILGVEKVEEGDSEDDTRPTRRGSEVDEATYKPRVYKWRRERKR